MALGILFLSFVVLSVTSILGISFLLLAKNNLVKKVFFYMLSILGMGISITAGASLPTNYILDKIIIYIIGLLSVLGVVIHIKTNKRNIAYTLTIISIILGILKLFNFI